MIIGLTGSFGAGKGEKVWETFARPCLLVCEYVEQTSDKVYSACKAAQPGQVGVASLSQYPI